MARLRPLRALAIGVAIAAFLTLAGAVRVAEPAAAQPQAQAAALERLARDSQAGLELHRRPGDGPFQVMGRVALRRFTDARTAAGRGRDFWAAYGPAFGVRDAATELRLRSAKTDVRGVTHLRYDQRHRGLAVHARQLLVHLDSRDVIAVNGEFEAGIDVGTEPTVSAAQAKELATQALRKLGTRPTGVDPKLLVYVHPVEGARLAWRVAVPTSRPFGLWRVFVDARTAAILASHDDLHTARDRHTHTNGNAAACNNFGNDCHLPGAERLDESGCTVPSCDVVLTETHARTGEVYDYFSSRFGRDSYDDHGSPLISTAHFAQSFDNAFWCPDDCMDALFAPGHQGGQMVYGDGSYSGTGTCGSCFSALGRDPDVVTHELTHAVTSSTSDLVYDGQSGALNESYSDVFAAFKDDDGDRWLIGEQSFTPGTAGDALRSMSDPAALGQPGHMDEYVYTDYDSRGVHTNSGIPNRAAYLLAEGAHDSVGLAVAEDLYYCALTDTLFATADFAVNLAALKLCAQIWYPDDASVEAAVAKAFAAVGIVNQPAVLTPTGGAVLQAGAETEIEWDTGGPSGLPWMVELVPDTPPVDYVEGFEAPGLPAGFESSGDEPWVVSTARAASGDQSLRSGDIGHNGRSVLEYTTRTTTGGTVSFEHFVELRVVRRVRLLRRRRPAGRGKRPAVRLGGRGRGRRPRRPHVHLRLREGLQRPCRGRRCLDRRPGDPRDRGRSSGDHRRGDRA